MASVGKCARSKTSCRFDVTCGDIADSGPSSSRLLLARMTR
jgi:hypothetical protein